MKKELRKIDLFGTCHITAAVKEDGKEESQPTFAMDAYNGGMMDLDYWGMTVIDLAGMTKAKTTPILYAHDTYEIDNILGQADTVDLSNGKITASGVLLKDSETAQKVINLAKGGFEFQASIGATPVQYKFVEAGETVDANGQTFEGPFYHITKSKLKEISILPLGADESTTVAVKAAANEGNMNPEEIAKAEKKRVAGILALAKDHSGIAIKAVAEDWTIEATENAVLKQTNADLKAAAQAAVLAQAESKKALEAEALKAGRPEAPHIVNRDAIARAMTVESITAAACINGGLRNASKSFSDEALNKAGDVKARSLSEVVRACLAMDGKTLDASHRDPDQFLRAAFSTAAIGNVISNIGNKFMIQGFAATETTWSKIAYHRNVQDFKKNTGVQLVMASLLQELAPNGEIQHGELSDSIREIQADTKALMLGISRQNIINDDLGILGESASKFGYAASRTLNKDFWAVFNAATANALIFDAAFNNKTSGALAAASFAVTEGLFLALKDADGNPIGTDGSYLLAGTSAYAAARELYLSQNMVGSTRGGAANVFAGLYEPLVSRYLTSAVSYALVGNPMAIPVMEVAFLNGVETPVIETAQADFNTLGIQMRCYYDYGVAFGDKNASVFSTGAAG